MSGEIPTFALEQSLLRFELSNFAVCIFESAKYIGIEAKLCEGAVYIRGQKTSDIFIPLIVSDPAEVG